MAALNFNASTVAPSSSFDVLPAGWYNVRMTESVNKPTKDGKGSYLAITLTVIDGPATGRKIFDRLNLVNKNETAVKIAYETLSAICHATGVIQLQDSTQLHGIPMQVKVKIKPAEGGYEEGNETAGYKKIEGGSIPGAPVAPAWVQPAAAPMQAQQQVAPAVAQPWTQQPQQAPVASVQQPIPQAPVAQPAPVQAAATPPWATQ